MAPGAGKAEVWGLSSAPAPHHLPPASALYCARCKGDRRVAPVAEKGQPQKAAPRGSMGSVRGGRDIGRWAI